MNATRYNALLVLAVWFGALLPAGAAPPSPNAVQTAVTLPYGQNPGTSGPFVYFYSFLPGSGISAGGMALDYLNNVYISDFGTTNNTGSIILIPADGSSQFVIMKGLDRPSDIEITPDQRGLVIAQPDGSVVVRYFGITLRPHATSVPLRSDSIASISTDRGPVTVQMSPDGMFHFPGVLWPLQQNPFFDLYIRSGILEFNYLGLTINTGGGSIIGETVVDLSF